MKISIKYLQNIKWKKWILIFASLPILAITIYFLFRNTLLHKIVAEKSASFRAKKNVALSFTEINFSGISGIKATNLIVAPIGNDTLLTAETIYLHVRLLPLFIGHVRIDEVAIENMSLNIFKKDSLNNYSFLMRKKKINSAKKTTSNINLAETADDLLDNIFDNIPSTISIKNTSIVAELDDDKVQWSVPIIALEDGTFNSTAKITEDTTTVNWHTTGEINKSSRKLNLKLYHEAHEQASLPFLMSKFQLKCGFDTLHMSIDDSDFEDGKFYLTGNASIYNVVANHWRIAPTDVVVKNAALNYKLFFGEDDLGLDSTTSCKLNDITINPYVKYSLRPTKTYALDIKMPACNGNSFFNSLPQGLFSSLEGLDTKGDLAYNLHFYLDEAKPNNVEFSSSILPTNFKINKYGNSNLGKMNGEFMYTAYEKDRAVATFSVGPSNPNFTPLEQISPYLRNAVLVSEDGDFFWHKGFNENAFRKSIATNFKERKFKRGGSTISMQLVKNVFLTRKKTVARKLEEALIVWLLENNRITSKNRMYEVYMNVIEWGPNVYGATEASRYYFNKHPMQLTISESIFLAMIVPRPKYFYWNFDDAGKLKSNTASYFKHIATHLNRREIITEEELNGVSNAIDLVGIAKDRLKIKTDSIPADSLQILLDVNEQE